MTKITREDIQRIGDEDTLLHFLQEKLDLPIKEGTTLGQIASPMLSPFLGLDDAIANQIIDCHEFRGICIDTLGARKPLLIRFRREQNYEEILRKVAEGLSQKKSIRVKSVLSVQLNVSNLLPLLTSTVRHQKTGILKC